MSTKKVALISGANKGIGFETARQLGKQGVTVLLGARNLAIDHDGELGIRSVLIERFACRPATARKFCCH